MLSLWMTLLVAAAGLSDGEKPDSPAKSNITATASARSSPRQGYELRDVVRTALRQWARPSDEQSPHAAREFLVLYRELQADSQLAQSQRDTLRTQVRNRLAQLSDQISQRIARDKRQAKAARPKNVAPPAGQACAAGPAIGPSASGRRKPGRRWWAGRLAASQRLRRRTGSRGPDPERHLAQVLGRPRRPGLHLLLAARPRTDHPPNVRSPRSDQRHAGTVATRGTVRASSETGTGSVAQTSVAWENT